MKGAINVGNVQVCPSTSKKPYRDGMMGEPRVNALRAFRDGTLSKALAVWHTPAEGGARKLKSPGDIDWATFGD